MRSDLVFFVLWTMILGQPRCKQSWAKERTER